MAEIGKINKLNVVRRSENGVYLDGDDIGEILLPNRYVPDNCETGDEIEVFIFFDSEDRITATTEIPHAQVGEFALLKIVAVNAIGAWLDWGLPKDLLVPYREQRQKMREGKSYIVHVYLDQKSMRMAASSKLDKFIDKQPFDYKTGEKVDLLICRKTEIGYNAIVNNSHWGLLFKEDVFKPLKIGQLVKGYIKRVRGDKKIDLTLQKTGYDNISDISKTIFGVLLKKGGFVAVTDKTSPDNIKDLFGVSKKSFKKAIGNLYKKNVIIIEENGIRIKE